MNAAASPARAAGIDVLRVGEVARAALERSGGVAVALAAPAGGPYYRAGEELLWVGARCPAMHPRVVVTAQPAAPGAALRFARLPARGWIPELPVPGNAGGLAAAAARLRAALARLDAPRGFGALLAGGSPGFPLELGAGAVRALAVAIARDDPPAACEAARPLLGFGTGLTPAGDDLVGAALFARRFLAGRDARWAAVAGTLAREIAPRSHPVSAALFGDLANGRSFAPLHATAQALAAGDDPCALAAARELAAIGHSSGWDMLTGLLIGIGIALPS